MDTPAIDSCLAGRMGVSCRSPLSQWPSPPAAHAHHSGVSGNILGGGNMGVGGVGSNGGGANTYMNFSSPMSDNENSDSMMSDCSPLNPGSAASSPTGMVSSGTGAKNCTGGRQNQVGTIMLHGEAIVSLVIDNKVSEDRERLCLAQISNTLLKNYSYNEIHNRRVALGITCVQCTPVQLEILRRAGAMPVSSRRCGMITKREAERLVKSFLEENTPPKLPEDFAFDVHHECGWGCRGFFEPSRYNSSRAKCIKCTYCNMYFSPNKFIFHFHRTPESKYNHPDAANFNSWRRHLKLYTGHDNEEIVYKWEDVKAMFNGGTRKRVFTSGSSTSSTSSSLSSTSASTNHSSGTYSVRSRDVESGGSSSAKKVKASTSMETNPYLPKPPPFPNPFNPYNWLTTPPGKTPYPFMAMNSSQSMCFGFPPAAVATKDVLPDRMKSSPLQPPVWMGRTASTGAHFPLSSMDLFWDKAFGFPQAALGFRNGYPPGALPTAPVHSSGAPPMMNNSELLSPRPDLPTRQTSPHAQSQLKANYERRDSARNDRMSAFKRVVPTSSSPSSSSPSPRLSPNEENDESGRKDDEVEDDDSSDCAQDLSTHKDMEDCEEIDVEEEDIDERKRRSEEEEVQAENALKPSLEVLPLSSSVESENALIVGRSLHDARPQCDDGRESTDQPRADPSSYQISNEEVDSKRTMPEVKVHEGQDSELSDESDAEAEGCKTFLQLSKEDLCDSYKGEVTIKRDREMSVLKENLKEDLNREKSFREHMARQLEKLRETLTNELEQERKLRFALQQKLKEAHDALQNFSCGLLSDRRDIYPLKDTAAIPR